MTSYLLTCSLYRKMSRFKVFQYEIVDRMSYLTTLYDNFEIFQKKNFQWGRIFENRGDVCEISTDFQTENVSNSPHIHCALVILFKYFFSCSQHFYNLYLKMEQDKLLSYNSFVHASAGSVVSLISKINF